MTDALGVVAAIGRGDLLQQSLGSQTLLERAVQLLTSLTTEVVVVDDQADVASLRERLGDFDRAIVHDPLCPLVAESFVRRLLDVHAELGGRPTVAVRPVIETIKAAPDGVIATTVDRDLLRVAGSPAVVSTADLAAASDLAAVLADSVALVAHLRAVSSPHLVTAPAAARRIDDPAGLRVLHAIERSHLAHPVTA